MHDDNFVNLPHIEVYVNQAFLGGYLSSEWSNYNLVGIESTNVWTVQVTLNYDEKTGEYDINQI